MTDAAKNNLIWNSFARLTCREQWNVLSRISHLHHAAGVIFEQLDYEQEVAGEIAAETGVYRRPRLERWLDENPVHTCANYPGGAEAFLSMEDVPF